MNWNEDPHLMDDQITKLYLEVNRNKFESKSKSVERKKRIKIKLLDSECELQGKYKCKINWIEEKTTYTNTNIHKSTQQKQQQQHMNRTYYIIWSGWSELCCIVTADSGFVTMTEH